MSAPDSLIEALRQRLRFRRIKVGVYSPEAWAMVERMQERIDQEHAWVHRLEDEIARLRNVIDRGLIACVNSTTGSETASRVTSALSEGQQKVPRV